MPQQQFKGYSQDQMGRIASKLGHTGGLDTFNNYLNSNPSAAGKYNALKDASVKRYARGGMVKSDYDAGGLVQTIFKDSLGRQAGTAGADYYGKRIQSLLDIGTSEDLVKSIIGKELSESDEGVKRAGNNNQQQYVSADQQIEGINYNTAAKDIQNIYQEETGRAGDAPGVKHYQDALTGGGNITNLRSEIDGSLEGQQYNTTGQQRYVKPKDQIDTGVDYRVDTRSAEEQAAAAKAIADAKAAADKAAADAKAKAGITTTPESTLGQTTLNQSLKPELATGATLSETDVDFADNQLIGATKGQVDNTTLDPATGLGLPVAKAGSATAGSATAVGTTDVAGAKQTKGTTDANTDIKTAQAALTGETSEINDDNKVTAQEEKTSAVTALTAAQELNATKVNGEPTRTLGGDELVNPVADAQTAAAFTEQITAAQADPSSRATVQGQLATLMTSFDNGNTPAWAAGAMRNVTAQMSARGIGSSSMAGQALIQAALETALPIATADAQTFASFEVTNLNNKQQRAMLAAQQRATFIGQEFDQEFQSRVIKATKVSEIANMNFTATQQIAIENAQLANTVNLTNLSNRQAKVMAEAAALSQLDIANLNNRQQEEVQNAQAFLDMDMANLNNEQQTSMFKAQSRVTAILSDTAAENARKQFNATSDNQMEQFYQQLSSQVSQFNASQKTAVEQSNAGETGTASRFNAEIKNQRDQFNAANSLVINQSNAQWRREIATAENVTINRVNEINAKSLLDISNTAYNNLWQEHRDEMDWAYQQSEGGLERYANLVMGKLQAETTLQAAQIKSDGETSNAWGTAIGNLLTGNLTGTVLGKVFSIA